MPEKDLTAQDMDVLFAARGVKSAQSTPTATPPEEPCPGCKEKLPTTPSLPYPAPPSPAPPTEPAHPTPYPAPPTEPTTTWQTESTRLRKQLTDAIRGVQPAPVPTPDLPSTRPTPAPSPRVPTTPPVGAPHELRWSQLGVGYVNMPAFARPMPYGGLSGFMRGIPKMMPRAMFLFKGKDKQSWAGDEPGEQISRDVTVTVDEEEAKYEIEGGDTITLPRTDTVAPIPGIRVRVFRKVPPGGFLITPGPRNFGEIRVIFVDGEESEDCLLYQYTRVLLVKCWCDGSEPGFDSGGYQIGPNDENVQNWRTDPRTPGAQIDLSKVTIPRKDASGAVIDPPYYPFDKNPHILVDAPSSHNPASLQKREKERLRRLVLEQEFHTILVCKEEVVWTLTWGDRTIVEFDCEDEKTWIEKLDKDDPARVLSISTEAMAPAPELAPKPLTEEAVRARCE